MSGSDSSILQRTPDMYDSDVPGAKHASIGERRTWLSARSCRAALGEATQPSFAATPEYGRRFQEPGEGIS